LLDRYRLLLDILLLGQSKGLVPPVVVRGISTVNGSRQLHTGHLILVEDGFLATEEAVLVCLYSAILEEGRIADVEDGASVVRISIVAIGTISTAEGSIDVT